MSPRVEARAFVRSAARQWLLDEICSHLDATATVTRNEPRELADVSVWLGDTTGQVTYPVVGRGLPRQDTFTTLVICSVIWPADDPGEAEQRVQSLASGVLTAVSGDPHLDVDIDGVIDVTVTSVDGPDVVPAAEGFGAVMALSIQFDVRITR